MSEQQGAERDAAIVERVRRRLKGADDSDPAWTHIDGSVSVGDLRRLVELVGNVIAKKAKAKKEST